MARTWCTGRGWNARHQERITASASCNAIRSHLAKAVLCSLAASFAWTTACAGASGPGIGLKIGAQTLKDPIDLERTTRARLELEISSPVFADHHVDLAFTIGGSSLGSLHDDYVDSNDGVVIEESYDDDFSLFDMRLAARLYPFGYDKGFRPYLGAGIGYFWFLDRWKYEHDETVEDPHHPGRYDTFVDEDSGTDTLAHGLFPFALAGLAVAVGDHVELMFELQYDFAKKDAGIDLGGPIYMFGGRVRF